jgi:hypothetical protein
VRFPKRKAPVRITKIGVREFRLPVNAPSILVSAMQNKNAGKKLPSLPGRKQRTHICIIHTPFHQNKRTAPDDAKQDEDAPVDNFLIHGNVRKGYKMRALIIYYFRKGFIAITISNSILQALNTQIWLSA